MIRLLTSIGLIGAGMLAACGSSKNVGSATCNASVTVTQSDCKAAGTLAGCEVSTTAGSQGCAFESCDTPPSCPRPSVTKPGVDAGRDPTCDLAEANGLFPVVPPCANYGIAKLNGVEKYTCPCSSACPCGYKCGSIALKEGGFIGNVCAP